MLTWIVGSRGLLGGAVAEASQQTFVGSAVPWLDPAAATEVLASDSARFAAQASREDWAVIWAAGGGGVPSSRPDLEIETKIVERFVSVLRDERPPGNGAFFLASSAGGVYAGSHDPPFSEATPPQPVSSYGEAKLAQERLATRILAGTVPVVIGRLSNLYGPRQDLTKAQGLVSHLCLAAATRRALNLFVPMDTIRDYLYVDDAAAMVVALTVDAVRDQPEAPLIRNIASGWAVSVAFLVRTVQLVAHRPVLVALGNAPTADPQTRDLRVTSCASETLARLAVTSLPVGIKRVYEHTLTLLRGHPSDTARPPSPSVGLRIG